MYDVQTKEETTWETKVSCTTPGLALAQIESVKNYYHKEVRVWDATHNKEIEDARQNQGTNQDNHRTELKTTS